jgi:hypothetical protein
MAAAKGFPGRLTLSIGRVSLTEPDLGKRFPADDSRMCGRLEVCELTSED